MVIVDIRGRPLEQAQVLWQRALEHADVDELLTAARNDSTTLAHALALGRTQLRGEVDTVGLQRAVHTLERAVEFLGIRPLEHAAAMNGARDGA